MKGIIWKIELKEINKDTTIVNYHKTIKSISKHYNISINIIKNIISGIRKSKIVHFNNKMYDITISQILSVNLTKKNILLS